MLKRAFDIVASAIGLVVLGPMMLLIVLLVRLELPGRAIFRQRRCGWKGQPFTMLKFRTMKADVEPYGSSPHAGSDPRLTRTGRFLRETSLDELPQLINVLAGRMSLVGPRPLYERQADQWNPRQRGRLDVRPGITGYAQVYGRGAVTIEQKIELDLYYVEHQSFWLDLKVLFKTIATALSSKAQVYERQYSNEKEYEKQSPQQEDKSEGSKG